jgi:hypothetical protein
MKSNTTRKLKIKLPKGWFIKDHADTKSFTCSKLVSGTPGHLRITLSQPGGKNTARPTSSELLEMSRALGAGHNPGSILNEDSGENAYGNFGTIAFSTDESPYTQIWNISNGKEHIHATYTAKNAPDPLEIAEASRIVSGIRKKFLFW